MSATIAYIAVGSNLGDRGAHIATAKRLLDETPDVRVLRSSAAIETTPAPGSAPGQGPYLNAVLEVETSLPPRELMDRCLEVERACGRKRERGERWGPRTIDLDLLLFGEEVIDEPGLTLPHPRMHERDFVLRPLAELAPDLQDPLRGQSVQSLLLRLENQSSRR